MAEKCPKLSAEIYPKVLAAYTALWEKGEVLYFLKSTRSVIYSAATINKGLDVLHIVRSRR
jgi:hypothetical protein